MDYVLSLRSEEPCDIFLISKTATGIHAIVVESKTAYCRKLADTSDTEFTLLCGKHSFAHRDLAVTVVDDFALVDGSACYNVLAMNDVAKEVYAREISGS